MDTDALPITAAIDLGEAPAPTPGAFTGANAPDSMPGTGAADPAADDFGVAYDPAKHERQLVRVPGGKRRWRLKRGNGARAASGKPLTGSTKNVKVRPVKPEAPAAIDAPLVSKVAPDPKPEPEPAPASEAEKVAEVMPASEMTGDDYRLAGETATGTLFGVLRLVFGKAWEPASGERSAWRDCFARLWQHYRWPRLSPVVELITLFVITIEKRAGDEETKSRWTRWFGRKPKEQKPEPVQQQPAAVIVPEPAKATGRGDSFLAVGGRAT